MAGRIPVLLRAPGHKSWHNAYNKEKTVAITSTFKSINFEAAGILPEQILAIRPTEEESRRVESLVNKHKEEGLTSEERAELEHYVEQEHVMSMAKIRALQLIQARGS